MQHEPCRNAGDSETLAEISELVLGYREAKNADIVSRVKYLKTLELGDGEPSPLTPFGESQLSQTPGVSKDPAPKYSDYAEAIEYHDALAKWVLRNFESGEMSAGRLACVFDCVEFATKKRESGAAQEVSPEHILRNLLAVIHRDGGHYATEHGLEKAGEDAQALVLKERVEDISPPSPEALTKICNSYRNDIWQGRRCTVTVDMAVQAAYELGSGDTRELKAALNSIIHASLAAEGMFSPCHICRPSDKHRHEEGCPILLAERLLGEPTKE